MDIRLCEKRDEDSWINLNREFMLFEIQGGFSWGDTEKTPDSVFRETFRAALQNPLLITLFLIEEDGVPIGFINLMTTFSVWSHGKALIMDDLFIKEEYRGRGYGRDVMQFVENYAKDNDYKRLQFQSEPENPDAKKFYNAMGYASMDMHFYVKYI